MSAFFAEYGMFLLKSVTVVVAIVVVIGFAAASSRKASQEGLEVENINKKHKALAGGLRKAVLKKDEQKKDAKEEKKREKEAEKSEASRPRTFVIDFHGDLKASAVPSLREEVSAILDVATERGRSYRPPRESRWSGARARAGSLTTGTNSRSEYSTRGLCRQGRGQRWLPDGLCGE